MRKSVALIVAAGLLVTLAGCSSSGGSGSCTPLASSGDASKLISASGDFGTSFTTDIPTPLNTSTTQVSTLIAGTGKTVQPDGLAAVTFSLYDGTTGQNLQGDSTTGTASPTTSSIIGVKNTALPGLQKALACATVGSRVAAAIAPADGFGDSPNGPGIAATDSLVMVFDITAAYPNRADGAIQPAQAGFPSVALAPDGRPGITIPSGAVPTDKKTALLKKGDGPAVAEGDQVIVQYTAVVWEDKTVAASTWEDGVPKGVAASSSAPLTKSIVPELVGKTVGSQYITVLPPADGFGSTASTSPVVPANSTLVYVVDVLGIIPAAAGQ